MENLTFRSRIVWLPDGSLIDFTNLLLQPAAQIDNWK